MPCSSPALRSVARKKMVRIHSLWATDVPISWFLWQLVANSRVITEFIFPWSLEVILQIDLRLGVIGISHPPQNRTKPVTKPNPPQTRTKPAKHHTKRGFQKIYANPNFLNVFFRKRLRGLTKTPRRVWLLCIRGGGFVLVVWDYVYVYVYVYVYNT